ncbi:MAG TPA: PqiC family protein [Polyangiaceae bacterium]|jgi:uncharacterized lipoprotein YmbA|nr:PqiC family protein [Polyangiaceae bacterium]
MTSRCAASPALRRAASFVLAAALMAACGSSPEPVYFALGPSPGTIHALALGPVEIREPGIAGYLDHSELLARSSGNELRLARAERWGEPLGHMIGRVITEDLTARLQGTVVFDETSGISLQPVTLVELAIQRFDSGAGGQVILRAQVAVHDASGSRPPIVRTITRSALAASTTRGTVTAMSALLGGLSDEIANMLVARSQPLAP